MYDTDTYLYEPGAQAIAALKIIAWINLIGGTLASIIILIKSSQQLNVILGVGLLIESITFSAFLLVICSIAHNAIDLKLAIQDFISEWRKHNP